MVGTITKSLVLFVFTNCAPTLQAESFLGSRTEEVQQQLHNQLRILLGHGDGASIARLEGLQSEIKPLYSAMPKHEDGSLDQAATRYVLHRYFVQKHGWYVRGLELTGADKWSDSDSIALLEDRIPGFILDLFAKHRGSQTGLRELAVLAATLEDVVHSEAVQLLSTVFAAQGQSEDKKLDRPITKKIIETYLLFHIMPSPKYAELGAAGLNYLVSKAPTFYTGWLDTLLWIQDLEEAIDYDESFRQNPFVGDGASSQRKHDFNSIVHLVETMGEQYGQYQNLECRELKNALVDLSDGSGRVRLSNFYKAAFDGEQSHFSESPDYLRHLGLLDDTDPRQPSVIVTNYLYAQANCMAASGLYSICCIDECEPLMSSLERSIASHVAKPETLFELVGRLSSDTVAGPRNMSETLRRRLDDIASRHGGDIPLHGRLFQQWMHHAFPNECRYPHVTGSLAIPMSPSEWLEKGEKMGRLLKATKDEMQVFMEVANFSHANDEMQEALLPWTDEEELAVAVPTHPLGKAGSFLRLVALVVAMVSAVIGLSKMLVMASSALSLTARTKDRFVSPFLASSKKTDCQWV